jgi:photosystem II stability/assembly factor-like uncharacterized protein
MAMNWGGSILSVVLVLAAPATAAPDWIPRWKPIPQSSNVQSPPEKGEWTNMTPSLSALAAVPKSDVMVAVGENGVVMRSEDRGLHWRQIDESSINLNIHSVVAVPNRDVLIAVGDRGVVLRSGDKGAHWHRIESATTSEDLFSVVALENTDILVSVGSDGVVLRSEDGGVQWKQAEGTTEIGNPLHAVAGIKNTNLLIAVGLGGVILRSEDKGAHWNKVDGVPTRQNLQAIAAIPDTSVLIAVGAGAILRSDDYGEHWKPAEGATAGYSLSGVAEVKDSDLVIAVGARGVILRSEDKGAHWNKVEGVPTNFSLSAAGSMGADLLVAIGQGGTVLRSEDGGMHWRQVRGPPESVPLLAVGAVANSDLLFAFGTAGTVWRSDDKGAHWARARNSNRSRGLRAFTAIANSDLLVAVGGGGEILRSEDKGANWMQVGDVPTVRFLHSVVAVWDTDRLVAVGDGSVVLGSEDKGLHWKQVEGIPASQNLNSVVALPDTHLLVAVGDEGVILRSEDKGVHWHRVEGVPTSQILNSVVAMAEPQLLVAVGDEGVILRSEDKGVHWHRVEGVPASEGLNAIVAIPDIRLLIAVGASGVALRSRDDGRTWFRDVTRTKKTMTGVGWTISDGVRPDLIAVGGVSEIQQLSGNYVRTAAAASEFDTPSGEGFGIAWRYPAGRQVNCSGAEYRLDGLTIWNRIEESPVGSFEGGQQTYRLLWNPPLSAGTRIHYALDCTDMGLYLTWRQELPTALVQTWNPPEPFWNTLSEIGFRHPAWLIAVMAIAGWSSILMLLYAFAPQRLVALHELLPEGETPSEAVGLVERILAVAGSLLLWAAKSLLLFVSLSRRATNAWVVERADKAFEHFTERTKTVNDRANAIDLPVTVNGEEVNSTQAALRRLMQNLPMALVITGPGGSGKTTLACQIGRRALGDDGGAPCIGYRVIPLLVEQDLPVEAVKADDFARYHAGLLRVAVQQNRACSARLTLALLRQGRLMPIVDGLSERSAETRATYDRQRQDFPAARLVITTRDSTVPGATGVMQTKTIAAGVLYDFIAAYLRGKKPALSSEAIHRGCADLTRLLRKTPCTPLLATLWADQMGAGDGNVKGIADLKDRYIRRLLLPPTNQNEQLVDWLQEDLMRVAERELRGRFAPGQITRASAIEALTLPGTSDRPSPNERFALLEKSRLLEALSENENLVRVAPDPIAEHLVARSRVRTLGVKEKSWRIFLQQLDAANRPADFIQALLACFDHPDYGRDIPCEIRQELRNW